MGSGRKQPQKPGRKPPTNATHALFKMKKKRKQLKQRPEDSSEGLVDVTVVSSRIDGDGDDNSGIGVGGDLPLRKKLGFFLDTYQTANNIKLSSLELESFTDKSIVDLSEGDINNLGKEVKAAFGTSWKDTLCDNSLVDGEINPGNPAVLVISASAIRVLELLSGLKPFTKDCRLAKLFSRHIKIEEQVTLLKNRVNIAGGTPSRIKKLIDMEALGLSRLSLLLLDIRPDVKSYSLLSLPQVKDEFWDLYKMYFHQRVVEANLRICLYGPLPGSKSTAKNGIW
ncbi:hypothetical protein MLD38_018768 [Melastoma candidum]|uniref:Uncharacterized protein n=1 Tax=Melastoma candidum TaxID=119954 RepID=A0ACB9QYC5_9MYRT|nr:hypothetical protein MLD38_018768 [Melastoma candidum]